MTSDGAVTAVIETLQHLHVPFMIVGSLATNFHGVPRSTRDADFVVQLRAKDLEDVRNVIAVQRDAMDWDYIWRWCAAHGTAQALEEIRGSIPFP